jgi:hypothetical protein
MVESENKWREAVSLFCQLLEAAFNTPANDSRAQCGQYIVALGHVASFCTSMGGDKLISQRFFRLAIALFDIQYGLKPKLLEGGVRATGRLPDPSDDWHLRCYAALILELLVQPETSEEDAAKQIVKSCPNIKNITRTGHDPKTSLVYWRNALKELTTNEVRNKFAIESFKDNLKFLNDFLPNSSMRMEMATRLMKSLDEQAGALRSAGLEQ